MQKERFMKIFTKITAFALSLVLALGCLASCDGQTAEPNTPDTSYVANIKIKYATNDSKMDEAVSGISSSSVLSVDGNRAQVITESFSGDATLSESYVLDDGKLYHTTKLALGEMELSENEVASVDDVDTALIITDIGVGADITVSDFYETEMEKSGNITSYTCSDITEESAESIENIFGKSFENTGALVTLEGAEYYMEKSGDQLMYSILSCHFSVVLDGEIYKVTMHIEATYDYEAEPVIDVPDNTSDFSEVSYSDIIK